MRTNNLYSVILLIATLLGFGYFSFANAGDLFGKERSQIKATGYYYQEPGSTLVRIDVAIPDGFYLYHTELGDKRATGKPLNISLADGSTPLSFALSTPHQKKQKIYGHKEKEVNIYVHEKSLTLWLSLKEKTSNAPPPAIKISGQICSATQCISVETTVTPAATKDAALFVNMPHIAPPVEEENLNLTAPQISTNAPTINDNFDYAAVVLPEFTIQNPPVTLNYPLWLLMAFVAGIILNLMPCVLPVLSLKLMGFASHAHNNRAREIRLSIFFALGILTVFMALAAAAVLLGLQWGEQFQSESFNIAAAALIFAFALSFFGVYEFGLPGSATNSLSQLNRSHDEGYLGSFITGIVATIMATPCSGPFLGAVLAWAVGQSRLTVFLVFGATGLGMAFPYVLLSANKSLRALLPKPGNWMNGLRYGMGILLLFMALYFMLYIEPENLLYTNALLLCAAIACFIIGKFSTPLQRSGVRWLARASAVLILFGGAYLLFAVIKPGLTQNSNSEAVAMQDFSYQNFSDNLKAGKNVLIEFRADWCTNCKYNEYVVFSSDEVQAALRKKDVTVYRADISDDSPKTRLIKHLMNQLGGYALPFVAIFPADRPYSPHTLPDILSRAQVTKALEALPDLKNKRP